MIPSILAVDDHLSARQLYSSYLSDLYDVKTTGSAKEALRMTESQAYDLYLIDLMMPDINGIELMRRIRKSHKDAGFIVISQTDELDTALLAFREHPIDFLRKPVSKQLLLHTIAKYFESRFSQKKLMELSIESSRDAHCPEPVAGNSEIMTSILLKIRKLAASNLVRSILITGESGTGKEIAARLFHRESQRSKAPFISINCGLLTRELAASELFGVMKGIATGVDARAGKFALAHQGTLFLDEIAELPLEVQPMLLRVLQEKRFYKVGGSFEEPADVTVIAATNKKLPDLIEKGLFREDLYYRLSVSAIEMPPLRNRKEDIPALMEHLFHRHGGTGGLPISAEELEFWKNQSWPGNIRQLENALITRMITGIPLQVDPAVKCSDFKPSVEDFNWKRLINHHSFTEIKQKIFKTAIDAADGNLRKAARMLDIPASTLWDYVRSCKKNNLPGCSD